MRALDERDLNEILAATAPLWEEMRGRKIFVTGGTGFFGTWLIESFLHANQALALSAKATILTRDPAAFAARSPHLAANPALTLLNGDVRTFPFPEEDFDYIIHAATQASASQAAQRPLEMLSTIVQGTERVLQFAARAKTRKLLLTSSGAVYGPQPAELRHVPEEFSGAPDPSLPGSVYGEGKRVSELLCALSASASLEIKIARCFAFVGPHLPLDAHFAVGNFMANALAGESIAVAGDGAGVRSYLYATDLMIWLWTILFRAPSMRPCNVGSERETSILDLATTVAALSDPPLTVKVAHRAPAAGASNRYVPSTRRARQELRLNQSVSLEEALRRTFAWHRLES